MRVLVCGGRDFSNAPLLRETLEGLLPHPLVVIHGGAPGADSLAAMWARSRRVKTEKYLALWREQGSAAGPLRNQRMLDEGKPDLVIAFPGGAGTADMVRRARAANVPVRIIGERI